MSQSTPEFVRQSGIEPAVLPLLNMPEGTDVTIERGEDDRITIIDNDSGQPLDL